jgi:hypothetical protein
MCGRSSSRRGAQVVDLRDALQRAAPPAPGADADSTTRAALVPIAYAGRIHESNESSTLVAAEEPEHRIFVDAVDRLQSDAFEPLPE